MFSSLLKDLNFLLLLLFHINLTLTVAIVTENGRQIGLNRENVILENNLEVLQTVFLKIRYQHS